MTTDDLLTETQASEYLTGLGISYAVRTLQKQRMRGGGIPFLKFGSRVRYRRGDLDAHIQSAPKKMSTSE